MTKIGDIKRKSRGLSSKELQELSRYFEEKARKVRWTERENLIKDLGEGGRVVYTSTAGGFPDVVGQVGTIKNIYTRKGRLLFDVEFDEPVWTKERKTQTKEFHEWFDQPDTETKAREYFKKSKKLKRFGIRVYYSLYRKETGKDPQTTETLSGKLLVRIPPGYLKPATPEGIESGKRARAMRPLSKILTDTLNEVVG